MSDRKPELEKQIEQLKKLREITKMNRREFAEAFIIPIRTMEDWETGRRKMPEYLLRLMEYKVRLNNLEKIEEKKEQEKKTENINIITDAEGRKIVMINDIRFKGKTREEWKEIEEYLIEYVGKCYEIVETAEKVYIGKDFPDEFAHGKDKTVLKGPNLKAKANATKVIGELIEIASNKSYAVDYNSKHKAKAEYGWYRYDTRLALPVYNDFGELERYNIYKLRMLVRHDKDGKLYLYDFLRTKKETSSPLQ